MRFHCNLASGEPDVVLHKVVAALHVATRAVIHDVLDAAVAASEEGEEGEAAEEVGDAGEEGVNIVAAIDETMGKSTVKAKNDKANEPIPDNYRPPPK